MGAGAGVDAANWSRFLSEANEAVRYRWSAGTILGFVFNAHNKARVKPMRKFAESVNASHLFPNFVVSYSMETEKVSVPCSGGAGSGAALATYHMLIFSRS